MKTLYSLTANNTIKTWSITQTGNKLTTTWGDGPNQNRTDEYHSPEKAAEEMSSKISYQINRLRYVEEIPTTKPFMPMLAQPMNWNVNMEGFAIQPKYDGVRCIASNKQLLSRKNTHFTCFPHIQALTCRLPDNVYLDGELFVPGMPFEILSGYARRSTPSPVNKQFVYVIYDIIDTSLGYKERYSSLVNSYNLLAREYGHLKKMKEASLPFKFNIYLTDKFPIELCPTDFFDKSPSDHRSYIRGYHQEISKQHEGCMIRSLHTPYELNYRSTQLMKLKNFEDNEFQIVSVIKDRNNCGILVCKFKHTTFNCQMNWQQYLQRDIANHPEKYIGKYVRVKYEGYTNHGLPRCPKGIEIISSIGDKL
jgi:DNA ligase 1